MMVVNKEMKSLQKNHTWDLVELLKGRQVVGCKWIFKNEVDRKVEANLKAIEEIKAAIDMALRDAEMADSTNCS